MRASMETGARRTQTAAFKTQVPGTWPGTMRRDRASLDFASFDLFDQRLDLFRDALEPRVDVERLAIGIERALVVADVLHDQADPGQRPEMARLPGQHLAEIGERIGVVLLQEIDGGAAIPGLGVLRLDLDDGIEEFQRQAVIVVVDR